MSETLLIWLFAGTWGVFGAWMLWLTKANQDQSSSNRELKLVLLAISKRAADLLHHHDDRYKIDHLLDKYTQREDLTLAEWQELFNTCDMISKDTTLAKEDRLAAGLLHDLAVLSQRYAKHKMTPKFNITKSGL